MAKREKKSDENPAAPVPLQRKVIAGAIFGVAACAAVWAGFGPRFGVIAGVAGFAAVYGWLSGGSAREHVNGIVQVLCLFLVFSWIGFQQFNIPSSSMEPTLHGDPGYFTGDRVWVNKWWYGPRVPFMNKRLFKWHEPERWDIVVFKAVQENARHGTLIKRIVGMPGERIQIKDGKVYADGTALDLPEIMPDVYYTGQLTITPELWEQQKSTLSLSERTRIERDEVAAADYRRRLQASLDSRNPMRYGILEDEKYSVVPEDSYLVLGDNSSASQDGRFWGWLPNEHILGRATCIWWPLTRRRDFTGWTHTWWGMAGLYGIPALLIINAFRKPKKKQKES